MNPALAPTRLAAAHASKRSAAQPKAFPLSTAIFFLLHAASIAADDAITVKFEQLKSGHIVVPVKINGQGPFRLGFDTGSPPTFISTKLQRELGLQGQAARQLGAATLASRPVIVDSIEVGDLKATNFPVMILDHPTVKMLGDAQGGLEGLVGFTFFSRYRLTIDYEKQQMIFKPVAQTARRGGLDMRRQSPPPTRAVVFGATTEDAPNRKGIRVASVIAGCAADEAALKPGDLITSINDRWITGTGDFAEALAAIAPGLPARIKIIRDGKETQLTVKARPGL
jgi:predicted aspartyl protease